MDRYRKTSASLLRLCSPFKFQGGRPIKQGRGGYLGFQSCPFGLISSLAMNRDRENSIPVLKKSYEFSLVRPKQVGSDTIVVRAAARMCGSNE